MNVGSVLTKAYDNHRHPSRKNKPNLQNAKATVKSVSTKSYETKSLSTKNATQIMQNKPNLPDTQMNATSIIEKA
jgi:hypothetical protein